MVMNSLLLTLVLIQSGDLTLLERARIILDQERAAQHVEQQPLIIPQPEQAKPATIVPPVVPVTADPDNEIVVTYATTFYCPPCEALKRDIAAGKLAGFNVRVDNSFQPPSYPAIRYKSKTSSTGWAYVTGYDASTVPFLRSRLARKSVAKSKPVTRSMSQSEMRQLHNSLHGGGNWTWPGDLKTHLRTVHGVSVTR